MALRTLQMLSESILRKLDERLHWENDSGKNFVARLFLP